MEKILSILTLSILISGCVFNPESSTLIEELTANYIEEQKDIYRVDCKGIVKNSIKGDIHFKQIIVNENLDIHFLENQNREGAYRYHVVSPESVSHINCTNQKYFNELMQKIKQ